MPSSLNLAVAWILIGIIATSAAISGLFVPALAALLLLPLGMIVFAARSIIKKLHAEPHIQTYSLALIASIAILHATGLPIPEIAFDAVWYHLPVIEASSNNQGLVYLPSIYQSLNPLFSDLIYGLGYMASAQWGTKILAYLFFLSLMYSVYQLASIVLSKKWALIAITLISTFQVIAWQSTSFYVDLPKAYWEIMSLIAFCHFYLDDKKNKKTLVLSAVFFGASLATKLFSLVLFPFYWLTLLLFSTKSSVRTKITHLLIFTLVALIIPAPYYWFAYHHTGNPFYSFAVHGDKLAQIGGNEHVLPYLLERTITLPLGLYQLLIAPDYTSPLLLLAVPILLLYRKKIIQNHVLFMLILFVIFQYLIWWYIPPLSTRYALSGFMTWAICACWSLQHYVTLHPQREKPILYVLYFLIFLQLTPRIIVATKNIQYLFSDQSQEEYIRSKFDGHIDQHLQQWYMLK